MLEELDVVRVKRAVASAHVVPGAEGTIVHAFPDQGPVFLVEFTDADGHTVATEVLQGDDLELVWRLHPGQAGHRHAA